MHQGSAARQVDDTDSQGDVDQQVQSLWNHAHHGGHCGADRIGNTCIQEGALFKKHDEPKRDNTNTDEL